MRMRGFADVPVATFQQTVKQRRISGDNAGVWLQLNFLSSHNMRFFKMDYCNHEVVVSNLNSSSPILGVSSLSRLHTKIEPAMNCRNRRFGRFVLLMSAAFGLITLSNSRADASCGDYLKHGTALHDRLVQHARLPMSNNESGERGPRRGRCHGPFCQQAPVQAPLQAPVVSVDSNDRWGWIASIVLPTPAPLSRLAVLSEPVKPSMIAFRLDRPPKA